MLAALCEISSKRRLGELESKMRKGQRGERDIWDPEKETGSLERSTGVKGGDICCENAGKVTIEGKFSYAVYRKGIDSNSILC